MKPYVPDSLPLDCLDVAKLIRRVGSANAAIARYDGLLQSVVNPSVMLSPLTQREAVLSSRIEGTQATVDEVLEYEAGIEFDPEKTNDIQEVVNYRKTLTLASETLTDRPITLSLIKQMHAILMNSVQRRQRPDRPLADPAVPVPKTDTRQPDVLSERVPGRESRAVLPAAAGDRQRWRMDRLGRVFRV